MSVETTIEGKWHLVRVDADEVNIPEHRTDFVFHRDSGGLRGGVVARERLGIAPLASVEFDGNVLRLQIQAPANIDQNRMPFLVMRLTSGRFEGAWDIPVAGGPPLLKLVRARKP